jgi:hypothetical protein
MGATVVIDETVVEDVGVGNAPRPAGDEAITNAPGRTIVLLQEEFKP